MISADFEGFVNLTVKVGKYRAKILISGAVSADSVDSSAANRWLCRGFERNGTLFLPENFILMYNRLNKSRHITHKKKKENQFLLKKSKDWEVISKGRELGFSDTQRRPPLRPCLY